MNYFLMDPNQYSRLFLMYLLMYSKCRFLEDIIQAERRCSISHEGFVVYSTIRKDGTVDLNSSHLFAFTYFCLHNYISFLFFLLCILNIKIVQQHKNKWMWKNCD